MPIVGLRTMRDRWRIVRPLRFEPLERRELLAAGLTGQYFDTLDLTGLKLTRTDAGVSFDWGSGSPDASLGANTFSARWTGRVQPLYSESYTFYVTADDGMRLWVDQQLVAGRWTDSIDSTARQSSGQIVLEAGQWHEIKLEYYDNTGSASVKLEWSSPSQTREVIPAARLSTTSGVDDRGLILQETWTGIAGNSISSLTSNANYPSKPTFRDYLLTFESVQTNWGDSYGDRVQGYLVPSVTGNYVLAAAGDEQVELYLSSDSDPATQEPDRFGPIRHGAA